eukprot:CAMPEP_0180796004 /NCGR_PEP_ID=MMETSP1038_2-20121128/56528_1 /TAXON_ID=632150 /ORGANISM="Azadinium spinosum, Strain 3D9" /LENGTH=158 /DNA_ID=CAMNT_0022835015 /DNA_START=126 /DNA_END=599 /DNA_ORIENTATION=+
MPLDSASATAVAVWVYAFHPELLMQKSTPGFLQFSGPELMIGTSFLDFVDSHSDRLIASLQGFVNNALSGPECAHEGCEIRLKARSLSSRVHSYTAQVDFSMADEDRNSSNDSGASNIVVVLTMSGIKPVKASAYDMPGANRTSSRRRRLDVDVTTIV